MFRQNRLKQQNLSAYFIPIIIIIIRLNIRKHQETLAPYSSFGTYPM